MTTQPSGGIAASTLTAIGFLLAACGSSGPSAPHPHAGRDSNRSAAGPAFELSGPHTDALYFTEGDALIVIAITAPTAPPTGAAATLAKIAAGRL